MREIGYTFCAIALTIIGALFAFYLLQVTADRAIAPTCDRVRCL